MFVDGVARTSFVVGAFDKGYSWRGRFGEAFVIPLAATSAFSGASVSEMADLVDVADYYCTIC